MNLEARLRYRELQRKSTELYYAEKYQEAMNIDKDLVKEFPELKTAIYYSLIATASKMKDYELTCNFLKEVLDEGGWYSELILRESPALIPLQGLPKFEDLVKLSVSRSEQPSKSNNITVIPDNTDPPYPLMLSLHGGGGFIEDEYEVWKSIGTQGYLLGIPRSTNLYWSGMDNAYWPDYQSSVKEIHKYMGEINRNNIIDPDRRFIGGFSQGGDVALQMALTGDISVCSFVIVAPGGGILDEPDKWQSLIDDMKNNELRGMIIRGTEDLTIPRDKLKDLVVMLNNGGVSCEFIEYPNLGHWYPPDLVDIATSFLASFE
ncbi:MAG: alpha/beta hydrolase [Candidatus Hodarchaeales archaeon]|jgi:predicted esterase